MQSVSYDFEFYIGKATHRRGGLIYLSISSLAMVSQFHIQ